MKNAFIGVLFFWSVSSYAEFSGTDLLEYCNAAVGYYNGDTNNGKGGACIGYIAGVIDSKPRNDAFCLPTHSTYEQVARVVSKYLNNNPEKLHYQANQLVVDAFSNSFPCDFGFIPDKIQPSKLK